MFNLSKIKDQYVWTITIEIANNGGFDKIKTKVLFNRLPHQERMTILEDIQRLDESLSEYNTMLDNIFDKVFAGWPDGQIKGKDGKELKSDANGMAEVLSVTEFRNALLQGYFDSSGGEVLKAGN